MKETRASSADVARAAGVVSDDRLVRPEQHAGEDNPPGDPPARTGGRPLAFLHTEHRRAQRGDGEASFHRILHPASGYISSDAHILRVIEGMTPVLNKARFQLVLQPLKYSELNYLQLARQDNVDGIILINVHDGDTGLDEVIEPGLPMVVIGSINHPDVCHMHR